MRSSLHKPLWTPAIAKQTSTASYVPGSLEQGCTFLLADIGESVPQIMVESFFDNILPPLFEGLDVDEVITALEGQGRITQLKRWNGFAVDPADSTEKKKTRVITNAIAEVAANLTGADSVLELQNNPNIVPDLCSRTSRSRPDGYLVLRDRDNGIHWADIGLSCEYKKSAEKDAEHDNVRKVIWNR
ncbi:hypothetical protein AcW1_002920 [Taiwanofungus camphoratus]|nr:hypothetical protein AcW1_002920 [Antrodia cinnamomea]